MHLSGLKMVPSLADALPPFAGCLRHTRPSHALAIAIPLPRCPTVAGGNVHMTDGGAKWAGEAGAYAYVKVVVLREEPHALMAELTWRAARNL